MCKPTKDTPPEGYVPLRIPFVGWVVVQLVTDEAGAVRDLAWMCDAPGGTHIAVYAGPTAAVRGAHAYENARLRAELAHYRRNARRSQVAISQPAPLAASASM